jgi:hypothetical protein
MCRPPRIPSNLEERTAQRGDRGTFWLCLLDNVIKRDRVRWAFSSREWWNG